jgi:hypothetical protein
MVLDRGRRRPSRRRLDDQPDRDGLRPDVPHAEWPGGPPRRSVAQRILDALNPFRLPPGVGGRLERPADPARVPHDAGESDPPAKP